ncbi:hypothetical protein FAIPA1_100124 [Frankia sp. AiPs1]
MVGGLTIPPPPTVRLDPARVREHLDLVGFRESAEGDYARQVRDIQAFAAGTFTGADGTPARSPVAEGTDAEVWILATSPGESARTAGELGLPLAASYHLTPSAVLETVEAYRRAFRPSPTLARPWVMVSADVMVAQDDASARELAAGYGPWVASARSSRGTIPYPSPAEVAGWDWTQRDRDLVADRVDTQFVGSASAVARGLRTLRDVTGADEIIVTTVVHDHAARVRSHELLARQWAAGSA